MMKYHWFWMWVAGFVIVPAGAALMAGQFLPAEGAFGVGLLGMILWYCVYLFTALGVE